MFFTKPSGPRLYSVDLGERHIEIPVAEIEGSLPGKTLLITAGMDGDEYAGIEAAFQAVEKYQHETFSGRLIILPVVNILGFENESSQNPLDQKFPKYIFPGRANNTCFPL